MFEMRIIHLVFYVMILHSTKASFSVKGSARTNNNGVQAMSSFANLLKTIVRVNEERVDAIRKIANLQDYMLTKNRLKFDDYYDSVETPDTRVILNLEDPTKTRRMDDGASLKKKCDQLYAESGGQPTPEIKETCSNHAFHKCTLACVHNFEETCHSVVYCTAELVDKAAKDCMRNCKKLFEPKDI